MEFSKWLENRRELTKQYTKLLQDVPQDPVHHPEGSALNHIKLVRRSIPKAIQELKKLQLTHPQLSSILNDFDFNLTQHEQQILALAVWLHDLGKASATTIGDKHWKEPGATGKIKSIGHEDPEHYKPLLQQLQSVAPPETIQLYRQNEDLLNFLVQNHMQLHAGHFNNSTIAKYFSNGKLVNSPEMKLLLVLMWSDKMGRKPEEIVLKGIQQNIDALHTSAIKANKREVNMQRQKRPFAGSPQEFAALLKSKVDNPDQRSQALKNKFPTLNDDEIARLASENCISTTGGFRRFMESVENQPTIVPADIPVSRDTKIIADALKAGDAGVEVYMVGGAVRDWIYHHHHHGNEGRPFKPKDEDITTNMSEEEILEKLRSPEAAKQGIRVKEKESVDTFGVVFASVNGGPAVEIAPFRKDIGSADGRRPERVERGTIHDDAMRRDLTMNNLYYDFYNKRILDFNPQGQGVEDVRKGIARPVGDPFQRFGEDKLRVLRLLRFFSRFNTGRAKEHMDSKTLAAVDKFKNLSQHGISPERIEMEFLAGVKQSQNTASYLQNLADLDLFPTIFPGLKIDLEGINRIGNSKNPRVVMAWLLRHNQNIRNQLNILKYPNDVSDSVDFLVNAINMGPHNAMEVINSRDKRLARSGKKKISLSPEELQRNQQITQETQGDLAELSRILGTNLQSGGDAQVYRLQHLSNYQPPQISGDELRKAGLQGAAIGKEQKRRGEEHYHQSFNDFLRQRNG